MWDELRGNFGARRISVLVLTAPLAVFAFLMVLLIALCSAAPWDILLDSSGFTSGLIMSYSIVIICSIVAPKFKFTVAVVIAIAWIALGYPYPWHPPDIDVDETSPWGRWAGFVAGSATAVFMVKLRLRSRWLLLLPAYFAGFSVGLLVGSVLASPLTCFLSPAPYWFICLLLAGSLGAIFSCRLMAPNYRNSVVAAAIVVSLLLDVAIYWVGLGSSAG